MQPLHPAGHACLRAMTVIPPAGPVRRVAVFHPPKRPSGPLSRPSLTAQQVAVARLAADGRSNDGIAAVLGIGTATVKVHLRAVYRRLGVAGRVELAEALGAGVPARADLNRAARGRGMTDVETDALWHLMHGESNKVIARRLKVSVPTVKLRLRTAYRVTGTTHRAALAAAVRAWF